MALPRVNRLPLRFERDRISKEGKTVFGRYFTVVKALSSLETASFARFGILLSKKTAKQAVDRNFIRRRTLDIISKIAPSLSIADYLIIPKSSVLQAQYQEIRLELSLLVSK